MGITTLSGLGWRYSSGGCTSGFTGRRSRTEIQMQDRLWVDAVGSHWRWEPSSRRTSTIETRGVNTGLPGRWRETEEDKKRVVTWGSEEETVLRKEGI